MPSAWTDYATVAQWENLTDSFLGNAWTELKNASDERVCFVEGAHEQSEFPNDLNVTPTFITNLEGSLLPTTGSPVADQIYIKDGTVQTGVSAPSSIASAVQNENSNLARPIDLGEVLQDEFSYSDATTLLDVDSNSGVDSVMWHKKYIKQLYEVLDYPEYIMNTFSGGIGLMSTLQRDRKEIKIDYKHTATTFTSCTVLDTAGNNLYTTGDLNETAPFSTLAQVLTYAITKYNGLSDNYVSASTSANLFLGRVSTQVFETSGATIHKRIYFDNTSRFRFIISDGYRYTSGQTYDYEKYFNDFYRPTATGGASTHMFGTGKTADQLYLPQVTKNGDGYHYTEIENLDWSGISLPSAGAGTDTQTLTRYAPNVNWAGYNTSNRRTGILLKPNLSAGTAWNYYS